MPNYAMNCLIISGNKKDIINCVERVNNGKDNVFDLNKIKPMPDELIPDNKGNNSGQKTKKPFKHTKIKKFNLGKSIEVFFQVQKEYIEPDLYTWAINNWGTKWNTINAEGKWLQDNTYKFLFDTAWTAPIEALSHLSKDYPKLTFSLETIEPLNCFAIEAKWQNGELLNMNEYYSLSDDYHRIHMDMLGEAPEEE